VADSGCAGSVYAKATTGALSKAAATIVEMISLDCMRFLLADITRATNLRSVSLFPSFQNCNRMRLFGLQCVPNGERGWTPAGLGERPALGLVDFETGRARRHGTTPPPPPVRRRGLPHLWPATATDRIGMRSIVGARHTAPTRNAPSLANALIQSELIGNR